MAVMLAAAVGVLFGTGIRLLLSRDLIRVAGGSILLSNAANLLLMAVGLTRGQAPIQPVTGDAPMSDPVVQALTLTSIVISFAVAAFLLTLVYRVYLSHGTLDFEAVLAEERQDEHRQEREAPSC
jgi:multicomponent Na+:H+ antiporter subunit C